MRNKSAFFDIYHKMINFSFFYVFSFFLLILSIFTSQAYSYLGYVGNSASSPGTISVIDTTTNTIVGTPITIGSFPYAIAITPDEGFAYISNTSSNEVFVIDTSTNTVVATIPVTTPRGIAITPDGLFAYVCSLPSEVIVIDTSSNTIVAPPIAAGTQPNAIAITPDGNFAYVTQGTNTILVIDTSTNLVVGAPITVGNTPIAIVITPDGLFAYVVNLTDNTVSVIDTTTNLVVGSPIPVGTTSLGIAITPDGQFVYVPSKTGGTITVIETSTNTVIDTITPSGTNSPINVAITPDGEFAYVTNGASNNVLIIDVSSNTVVDTIAGFNFPYPIAFFTKIVPPIPPLLPPAKLTGKQKKNDFAVVYELINVLRWEKSPSTAVTGYFVYRNGKKIAILNLATAAAKEATILGYRDHNRKKGVTTHYSVTAFDKTGKESKAAKVKIKSIFR